MSGVGEETTLRPYVIRKGMWAKAVAGLMSSTEGDMTRKKKCNIPPIAGGPLAGGPARGGGPPIPGGPPGRGGPPVERKSKGKIVEEKGEKGERVDAR